MRLLNALKPLALTLTAGLMLSAFATPAFAQGGGGGGGRGGGGGMFGGMGGGMGMNTTAPIGKNDIEKMAKQLKLTPDQVAAANALLESQMAEFNKKAEEFRGAQEKAREDFRENRDPSVFADLRPKMDEFRKYREQFEKQFFADTKGILDKQQTEQFASYLRSHKREQSMGRGMMSGERADVVAIVERMKLSDAQMKSLRPTLEAYETEIETPLDRRNAVQEKFMNDVDMRAMMQGDEAARQKADAVIKEGREAATAVRDINRKYAKQIESMLGGAEGEKFGAEFRKASFPEVYRERYTDRALAAAAGMSDLKPEQAEGLKALKEQYARDAKPIDEAGEKVVEDREANFSISNMMQQRMGGQGDEKAQEQRRQRRELDDATLEKLKGILTPEQFAKLPERQGGPGGQGGGDNQGGGQRRMRGGQGGGGNDGNNSGGNTPRRQRNPGGAPADPAPPAPKN